MLLVLLFFFFFFFSSRRRHTRSTRDWSSDVCSSDLIITDGKGDAKIGVIPQGSYQLSVEYQNQRIGPLSENAITSPTATVQLNVGSTATSTTTSAIVLLTIFGLAFFLILLAIKVRKPPPPPTI